MSVIFHITSHEEWERARAAGSYRAPSLESEGFIHCSTAEQVPRTLERFYRGRSGLVALVIDTERVTAPVRWEASDGEEFPHIYGPLDVSAVGEVRPVS